MRDEYLKDIAKKTDQEVKFLILKFLISGGRFKSDDNIRSGFEIQPKEKQQQLLNSYTFYKRLISLKDEHSLWSSITWILDLLPEHPYKAIAAIESYFLAHCLYMMDARIHGISDTVSLIEAKYI